MVRDQEHATAGHGPGMRTGAGQVIIEEPSLAAIGEAPEIIDLPRHADWNTRLQDVLAEITDLAQRVGGLRQLAELIDTLQHTKG